jgi:hypothetical protein
VQDLDPVEAGARNRIALMLLVLRGGGLRVLNAVTASVHPDEKHYAEDASWLIAPLPLRVGVYSPWKNRSVFIAMEPGVPLSRRLWLAPGTYEVAAKADDPIDVALDDQPVIVHGVARGSVTVGRFPRVTLSTPSSTKVREIIIQPAPGPAGAGIRSTPGGSSTP